MKNSYMNPISYVQNTRVVYSKWLQKNVKEVEVQFKDEEPAWIPLSTLLGIQKLVNSNRMSNTL